MRARAHWLLLLGLALIPLLLVLFAPPLSTGFVNDDFIEVGARHYDALDSLPSENWGLWSQRFVERALIILSLAGKSFARRARSFSGQTTLCGTSIRSVIV